MIHVGRKSYPYMEEINEGILRQFQLLKAQTGRVLDVGCGRGQLGEAIRALGWKVWGIEQSPEACATARTRLDELVEADLLDFDAIRRQLGDNQFDALIFSDVLEHLYDPRTVLENYLKHARPGGRVMISVPNGVVWTNRIMWILGQFNYADTGVMDRTHVRFFTFRTARQLVESAGCRVERVDSTPFLVRAALPVIKKLSGNGLANDGGKTRGLIDSPAYRSYMRYVYPAERAIGSLWKRMLAFRIIITAVKP